MTDYACKVCGAEHFETTADGIRDWEFGAGTALSYAYRRCKSCRVVQLHPFPTLRDLIAAYPESYVAFADHESDRGAIYRALFRANNALLKRRLGQVISAGAKVLDVGCGNGGFLARLRSVGATELHGIDFSETAARIAASKGIEVFCGVFADYPEKPAYYDAVFMNHYIEHVQDPVGELEKAARLLRKGGVLLGELPNYDSIDRWLFGRFWGGNHVPRHTFQYDPSTLSKLIRKAGFSKVTVCQQVNPGHFALSIQNWMQRSVPNLEDNPRIAHGRSPWFGAYLLMTALPNALFAMLHKSGMIQFEAHR